MGSVTANTTVKFATISTSGAIDIELDDDRNGDKSTFSFSDTVYFRVYPKPFTLTIEAIATAGDVKDETQTGYETVEQTLTFINESSINLSKSYYDSFAVKAWYGKKPTQVGNGLFSSDTPAVGTDGASVNLPLASGKSVKTAGNFACIMDVTYRTQYKQFKLEKVPTVTGVEEFPVVVLVIGT